MAPLGGARGALPDTRKLAPATAFRRSVRLYTATALAGGLFAAFAFAAPAAAQQGGAGGFGGYGNGGAGGNAGEPGGSATCAIVPSSLCQTPGGAAGAEPGGRGGDGSNTGGYGGPGGGGGGGGANGSADAPIGGDGGNGGNGDSGNRSTGGGGGGGGGNGLILTGPLTNGALVGGGNGGNGGFAGPTFVSDGPATGGGGGEGGTGIVASAGAIITNLTDGSITGGNGGVGGVGSSAGGAAGAHGAGGVGIHGSGLTITNAGAISGGLGGDGTTRALAIHLTGGRNTLDISTGSALIGGVGIDGTSTLVKSGAGTLTLSSANSYSGGTELVGGTLQLDDLGAIGAGDITFGGGSLLTTVDGSLGNNLYWYEGATGALSAATGTELTLTGTLNHFGPATVVQFGTATDTGTIIADFLTGSSGGAGPQRLLIGGGTFRAANGFMSLAIGQFDAVQIDSGATLDINGAQPTTTLNTLEGSGTLLNGGAISVIGAGDFAGTISGGQSVLKVGAGTLILTGSNDYTGTTTVSGGTLELGGVGALGTGLLTLSNGRLIVDASGTMGNAVVTSAGTSNLISAGTGTTLTLNGTFGFGANSTLRIGDPPLATDRVTFSDNLSATGTETTISGLKVYDAAGVETEWTVEFTREEATPDVWQVKVTDGVGAVVGTKELKFAGVTVDPTTSELVFEDAAKGLNVTFDFSSNVTFYSSGTISSLRVAEVASLPGGTVNFGFSGGSADSSSQLLVDAGTVRATNDSLSSITSTIARTEIARGATLDFNGQIDINGRGGQILNLYGAGTLLNDGENTYLFQGEFAGQIEGSQSILKSGAGTLILAGANSYSGTTRINAGTLQIGDGTVFGTLGAGSVTNNGTLNFWGGDQQTLTIANNIGGSGALNVLGGTVILTGNNSFSGGLTVAQGTLSLGSSFAAGGAGNTITTTGSVIDYADGIDNVTPILIASNTTRLQVLAGTATQSGAVGEDVPGRGFEKIGPGTLVLTASNGYSGGTLVSGGLIGFSTGDNLGSGNVTLDGGGVQWASGSTLDLSARLNPIGDNGGTFDTNGNDVVLASVLSGTGSITKIGAGILTLSDANTYGGGTFVSGGTLALGAEGAASSGVIALADGTRLLSANDPLTIANAIEIALGGGATLDAGGNQTRLVGSISGGDATFADNLGSGRLILTASNSYGGTTIASGATVQVGDGGTAGTLGTGAVLNEGVLVFDRSDEVIFSQAIGGAGQLVQAGDGTLSLTGTSTYSGGTAITGGTLHVGDGGTVGTLGTGDIVNDARLVFARSDTVAVADDIDGSGDLVQLGTGTLTLSGFNLYTGTTSVLAGTLAVSGGALSGTGLVEIGNGATLQATGFMGLSADFAILDGGGTIDTGPKVFDVFGSVDFGGMLTKTGAGTLLLDDGSGTSDGDGGITVLAGTLGLGSDFAAGTGVISLADGTTLANASCFCGELTLDNTIVIAQPGTAFLDGQGNLTNLNGVISGGNAHFISTSESVESGGSTFVLNGANTYGETIIGPNVAVILVDGTLGAGDTAFEDLPSHPTTPSALVFGNTADYTYEGTISGTGIVAVETDPGTTITLAGSNSSGNNFTGTVLLTSGRLEIDGEFGDVDNGTAQLALLGGCGLCGGPATLGGSGTFYGDVQVVTGTLAPGNSPGTLDIVGDLILGAGTILNYELGEAGTPGGLNNDLTTVSGNLTLDGTLNTLAWPGGYGPGYYRLIDYGGVLTDNTLDSGAIAGGLSAQVLTNIAGQVNVRLGPQVALYWDGSDATGASVVTGGNGGTGIWNAAATNWTAATGFGINDQWRSVVGAFAGPAAGTVTVEGTHSFEELRFETDGYLLQPFDATARLATVGAGSTVDVGAGLMADIGVIIEGAGLTKAGAGTLQLSAVNSYAGLTTVSDGTLTIRSAGSIVGNVQNDAAFVNDGTVGGALTNAGTASNSGTITGGVTNIAGATFISTGTVGSGLTNSGTASAQGAIDGPVVNEGVLTVTGPLTGITALDHQAAGQLNVQSSFGVGSLTGSGSITLASSTTMTIGSSNASTAFSGPISGAGGLVKVGTGTLTLGGALSYAGFTSVSEGMLELNGAMTNVANQVGVSSGATFRNFGTVAGGVSNDGTFVSTGTVGSYLGNTGTASIEGELNGYVVNAGTVTLSGTTTGIGNVDNGAAALFDLAGFDTSFGSLSGGGELRLGNGELTVGSDNTDTTFAGIMTSSGIVPGDDSLTKAGTGTLVLTGTNTYTGNTIVTGGTLTVSSTGHLNSVVVNSATFNNGGQIDQDVRNLAGGTASNTGTIAIGIQNSGTFTSTGTINLAAINNFGGAFNAQGAINGFVSNSGTLEVTGALTGITNFLQFPSGQTNLNGFDLTVGALNGIGGVHLGSGDATLIVGDGTDATFSGGISGSGNLTKVGTGELLLNGTNSYTGTTTIAAGTLRIGAAGALGNGGIVDNGILLLEQSGPQTVGGMVTGSGAIIKSGTGILAFAGNNTPGSDFTGTIQIAAGSLLLNGVLGDTTGNTAQLTLDAGTSLGGAGTFHGSAIVNGTFGPGNSPGTFTIAGDLALGAGTILNYEFGASGTPGGPDNDLVVVGGNLTLDGTLNILPAGAGYGPGYYRLFDYGGTLTDNGVAIGAISNGLSAAILTNINNQVNVVLGPQLVQYWDGGDMTGASAAVNGDGGSGTWNASNTNWTAEAGFGINDQWRGQIGVFAGSAGSNSIIIEGTQSFQELRFQTDGYGLTGAFGGDGLATTGGFSVIDVASGLGAEIGAEISGVAGLTKTGTGTLTLGGLNSYTGLTTVADGTLSLSSTGSLAGNVVNNATLSTAGVINGNLTNNGAVFAEGTLNGSIVNDGSISLTGFLGGVSNFTQSVEGSLTLNGQGLSIATLAGAGMIDLGGGSLSTDSLGNSLFNGTILGAGTLNKSGTGTLTLGGDSTAEFVVFDGTLVLTGSTTEDVVNYANFSNEGIVGGTVENQVGAVAANSGWIGSVSNSGTFTSSGTVSNDFVNQGGATALNTGTIGGAVFNSSGGAFTSTGTINGNLDNYGSASLAGQLNGDISNQGDIVLSGTTLGIGLLNNRFDYSMVDLNGFDTAVGSLTGDGELWLGTAVLTVGSADMYSQFRGVISGSGGLAKVGANVLALDGANTYTGLTTVGDGSLLLSAGGQLAGGVQNDARFENEGTVAGLLTNTRTARNEGTLSGGVVNSGFLDSSGTIHGNVVNSGTVYARGVLNGTIVNDGYVQLTGSLTGVTEFTQGIDGTLILDGETLAIGTLIGSGYVELGGGLLEVGSSGADSQFDGEIYSDGALTKVGVGTLTLTGWNSYAGTTTVSAGTLRNTGTLSGPVLNRATFVSTGVIDGELENGFGATVTLQGQLNGAIENFGDITLTGATTGIGELFLSDWATFNLNGFDTTVGSLFGPGSIQLGSATLTAGGNDLHTWVSGVISGSGGLTKVGTGNLILAAANTYTGVTTISAGSISLDPGAALAGAVQNDAEFFNNGSVSGLLTNAGSTTNLGSLNGGVDNRGTLATAGVINGNLVNTGTVTARGTISGNVANAGRLTLTGATTGIGAFTQTAAGTFALAGFSTTIGSLAGTGAVQLGNATLTAGGDNGSTAFAGAISGSGGLTKVGTGTLTLSGVSTYTGTTTVGAGTLQNTGTLAGSVVNHANFVSTGAVNGGLANSGTASLSGQLNGAVANSGALALTGTTTGIGALTQTFAGVFALNGSATTIGSLAGAGQVQLGGATLTTGGDNGSTDFTGVVSGSGGLTKTGTGTLTLSGVNTYTGLTAVTAGTLRNTGTLAGPVTNAATFISTGVLDGSLTNSGTASLSGQLNSVVANSGVLGLTGATTGIGAFTQTAAGAFALNDFATTIGSLSGAGQVQLGSAVLTAGGDNSSTDFGGIISGTGTLTKVGTGTLILSGENTFTGVTTIAAGMLQLGNGGAGGRLASSSVVDNGVLAINRSDMLQISAAISGSGSLVQAGSGTTELTGANSYTGGTLVSGGRLVGNTTSLRGTIETNATLEFAQATTGTYTGSLSGTGAFEKTGTGLLNLAGDSSTFTGATRVLGGQLAVKGLLSRSVVTVGAGATLMGLGPIGGLVAQAGSIVAPGNSVGTLQVNGNVQLQTGSTYQAEITPAAADLINATGTAQVAGTLAVINLGGTYTLGTTYVLVNAAGGRTGTFDAAVGLNSFGTKLRGRIVYTPTQVQLLIANNSLVDLACSAPTRNQADFLAALDNAVQNNGYDPQTLQALYDLDPAGLCRAVDQLSGGVYAAAASAVLEEERLIREAAIDRLRFTQDGEVTGTGVWGQLVGAWGHVNSDGTGFDVDNNREGAIFGVDTGGAGWRVGIYGHHIETELDADALASEAHIDRSGLGAYAGFASGSFRARVGASYSDIELTATRTIAFPGFSAATSGTGDGSMIQGFGEMAYRFDVGNETFLEPFADLALATVDLDAIDESGSAAARLRVAEQEHDIGRAIAGVRGDAAVLSGSTRLRIGIDAGLQHNFGDRSIAALIALDGAPQDPFTMRATELEPWAFVGGGRVAIDFGSNVTATVSYRGVLAGNRNDHAASGTLSVRF